MVEGVLLADVFSSSADHHRQFALVIHLVAPQGARQDDGIVRILDRSGRLDKNNRVLGEGDPAFLRVLPVVQADAENKRGLDRGQDLDHLGLSGGGLKVPQGVAGNLQDAFFGFVEAVPDFSPGVQIADNFHGLG
jgi:hypothetical protein